MQTRFDKKRVICSLLAVAGAVLSGSLIALWLFRTVTMNGIYPSGSDAMYHVFRGDVLYHNLQEGLGYPLFNRFWYNGVEPMRYSPPLSPILFAVCETIGGGDAFAAYLLYVTAIFIGGLAAWVYIGIRSDRPFLGWFMGVLWFFLPNNMYELFGEGDLSRALAMVFLPVLLYHIYDYLETGIWSRLLGAAGMFVLLILCHMDYAGMVALAVLFYLLIHKALGVGYRRLAKVLVSIPLAFLITGLYAVPAAYGHTSSGNAEIFQKGFQDIAITLNPFYRLTDNQLTFYFGLAAFVVAICGVLGSNRFCAPGFLNAVVIVLLTSTTAYSFIKLVPGSVNLQMLGFMSIGLCMICMSLVFWRTIRYWLLFLFGLILCLDCIPSLYWISGNQAGLQPEVRLEQKAKKTLITEAQSICKQRIALFDLTSLGAEGAYLVSHYGNEQMGVFGAGWESAVTADNVVRLNRALSDEYYAYMFDRCMELGADTVIIQKDQIAQTQRSLSRLYEAAYRCNYNMVDENGEYMLYHLDVDGPFGTTVEYDAIGIGESAYTLSLAFPNIEEAEDVYLDHYSYEYLSRFKIIYLSGFLYDNKEEAEELALRLAENGVRIVILADGMPENRESRSKTFLGVTCNLVQFENGYPILDTVDFGELDCDLFPRGYSKWITYYLNGLDDARGYIYENGLKLAFYGTGGNDNIRFIGLNIPFYYYITRDKQAELIMGWVMGMDSGVLPRREVHPMMVSYRPDGITVDSNTPRLNTGIAYHDMFETDRDVSTADHLMVVDEGQTQVSFHYPYLVRGVLCSLLGVILLTIFLAYVRWSEQMDRKEPEPEQE